MCHGQEIRRIERIFFSLNEIFYSCVCVCVTKFLSLDFFLRPISYFQFLLACRKSSHTHTHIHTHRYTDKTYKNQPFSSLTTLHCFFRRKPTFLFLDYSILLLSKKTNLGFQSCHTTVPNLVNSFPYWT